MIHHNVSTIQVFKSEEYQNFSMIAGNRPINQNKVSRIIKEIQGGNDMLQYYPIQVRLHDDKLEILDGQHRFFISRKLQRPIFYILVHEVKDMTDIARVNSNVEKWTPQNFIDCYIQKNNDNYIQLQKFISLYGINVGTSLRMLDNGTPGAEGSNEQLREAFETGLFKLNKWDAAVALAEKCKLFSAFEYWTDRAFIIAIHKIIKANLVSLEDLLQQYHKNQDMLTKQHTYKAYIYNLEQIANKNKQKRVILT